MIDFDAAIVAALAAGQSEREVAQRLGCSVDEVRAALVRDTARRLDPPTSSEGSPRTSSG